MGGMFVKWRSATAAGVRSHLSAVFALAISIIAVSVPEPVQAQTAPAAPVRKNVDANGVDLFTGKLNLRGPALMVGSQGNTLAYYRWSKGSGWSDSVGGFMNLSGSLMTVSIGEASDSFTVSGTTYTSTEANGSTLTLSGTTYTYTRADGTVVHFDKTKANEYVPYSNNGMILDVVGPDGTKLTFAYDSITYCKTVNTRGICTLTGHAYRPASVTSSYGFRLLLAYGCDYSYDPTDPYTFPNFACWAEASAVSAQNLAISASTVIASESFGYSYVGGTTYYNITDAAGLQTTYRMSGSGVVGITLPSHASEDVTIGYSGSNVVTVARVGAGTTTYGSGDVSNVRTVTVTPPAVSPAISTTTYTFDIAKQRMTSVMANDGIANRTTSFDYDSSGRLTKTTMPEGNYVQLTRDGRGNVIETRAVGKPGSGATDIVT